MTYVPGKYNRRKWAVLDTGTRAWYFAEKTGRKAAETLAGRLNREA